MKRLVILGVAGIVMGGLASARPSPDAKTDVKNAVRKLADQAGYSWTAVTIGANQGKDPQEKEKTTGRMEKEGYTLLSMDKGGKVSEAAIRGEKVAVKTADGWKNAADFDPKGDAKGKLDKSLVLAQGLQKYRTPAAEAAAFADLVKDLQAQEGGLYSGEFTDEGVKSYIDGTTKPGKKPADLTEPKITAKFWLKDGSLAKYEVVLEAKKPKGKDKTLAGTKTTVTTEISDVGSTKVELSDDAKKKLQ